MRVRDAQKFWEIKAKGESVGEIYLYGEISAYSWWGDEVTPQLFKAELDALGEIDTLNVYINSGGGDVFAGWSIISMLQRHKAHKVGYNDGLAASIAFDILMSMDEVVAMENSLFMTHNCWTCVCGNRHELRKQADQMEKIDQMMAETSARKSGKTIEEISAIQDAESWYTAKEALDEGFVDTVKSGEKLAACIADGFYVAGNERFDLARYKRPLGMTHEEIEATKVHLIDFEKPSTDRTISITGGDAAYVTAGDGYAKHDHVPRGTRGEDTGHSHAVRHEHVLAKTAPYNGGESEPVKDKDEAPGAHAAVDTEDAPAAQRAYFNKLRRKMLGGNGNG